VLAQFAKEFYSELAQKIRSENTRNFNRINALFKTIAQPLIEDELGFPLVDVFICNYEFIYYGDEKALEDIYKICVTNRNGWATYQEKVAIAESTAHTNSIAPKKRMAL